MTNLHTLDWNAGVGGATMVAALVAALGALVHKSPTAMRKITIRSNLALVMAHVNSESLQREVRYGTQVRCHHTSAIVTTNLWPPFATLFIRFTSLSLHAAAKSSPLRP